mmetsp:Transcript_42783/g.112554  ORF Transcript_42783/g.112554 Transcript_42783/m.112554 type:complete len:281 (+) Transcript_42783:223-1065(+)
MERKTSIEEAHPLPLFHPHTRTRQDSCDTASKLNMGERPPDLAHSCGWPASLVRHAEGYSLARELHGANEADEILLLDFGQEHIRHVQRRTRILIDDVGADEPLGLRGQAEQRAARAVADRVALHCRGAAMADGDAGHLVGEDVIVDYRPLALLAHQHPRVEAVVDPVARDERRALTQDGHARAKVGVDVVLLDAAAPLLGDEDARVLAVVDAVEAHHRVATAQDGHPRTSVRRHVVVLDQSARVVADEDADTLGPRDEVVQDVSAGVGAFDHDAVPGGG